MTTNYLKITGHVFFFDARDAASIAAAHAECIAIQAAWQDAHAHKDLALMPRIASWEATRLCDKLGREVVVIGATDHVFTGERPRGIA